MEEKERYYYEEYDGDYDILCKDNKEYYGAISRDEEGAKKLVDLLNQQDARIKELERETYPAYKREHQRRAYLENIEVPKLKERIKELEEENADKDTELHGTFISNDKLSNKISELKKLLKQQDKENQQLKQQLEDYKDICHKHYIDCPDNLDRVLLGMEQQLHDLPKKIVEEIRDIAGDFWDFNICEECGNVPDLNTLTMEDLDEILDTILKKYGGENE